MATEEDWQAYLTAVVDLAPPDRPPFRIVPASPGTTGTWPTALVPPVVVVTAWNPDSLRLTDEENRLRHALLLADLGCRDATWWDAVGRDADGVHREEGVAVLGLAEGAALGLARDHGQAAVYVWTPTAWEVVSCTDDRRTASGWLIDTAHRSGG